VSLSFGMAHFPLTDFAGNVHSNNAAFADPFFTFFAQPGRATVLASIVLTLRILLLPLSATYRYLESSEIGMPCGALNSAFGPMRSLKPGELPASVVTEPVAMTTARIRLFPVSPTNRVLPLGAIDKAPAQLLPPTAFFAAPP